jgi:Bacterial Ig domain
MRSLVVVLCSAAMLLTSTATASAGIWTPVNSGTTETITALDYRADKTVFGTANGKIFTLAGGQRASFPGLTVIDLKLNPAGTTAVAALTGGKVSRSIDGGTTWGPATQLTTYNSTLDCNDADGPFPLTNLTQDPTAVAWASDTTAYLADNLRGSIQKTVNGGGAWNEVSRQSSGLCKVDSSGPITDIAPVVGSDSAYFIKQSFGGTVFTSDALASSPSTRGESVNCFDQKPSLAVDTATSNHVVAGDRCTGGLSLEYSEDGGTNYTSPRISPEGTTVNGEYDVSFAGGTAIWVGNGGDIFNSVDGRNAYLQRADGVNAARDWRTVSAQSATSAAIGGVGGALVVSTSANTIPDLIPPAGTISGPITATAGQPATYTANVTDAGGSGIDPASFQWSATGIPGATGNPAAITFPSAGFYTLTVAFKDLAGNAASATISVTVAAGKPVSTTVTKTVQVPGGSITLGSPRACVAPGGSFTATLSFKKSTKKGTKKVKVTKVEFYIDGKKVKTDSKAPFRQTLTVKKLKAGTKHTLKGRATIKVKKGKSPKKSVNATFSVCA